MFSGQKLETHRLILRQLTFQDAEFIIELLNTPGWIRHIGDRNVRDIVQARNYLKEGPLTYYAMNQGLGLLAVVSKKEGIPVGLCGLLKRTYLKFPDIGYAVLPEFEGRGIITESCNCILENAKLLLGLRAISAITDPQNMGSIKVLQKLGFKFIEVIEREEEKINSYQLDL